MLVSQIQNIQGYFIKFTSPSKMHQKSKKKKLPELRKKQSVGVSRNTVAQENFSRAIILTVLALPFKNANLAQIVHPDAVFWEQ
mmetsp:Transcript_7326/g.12031  ORF Transcript_7326/g.12031 Transcript_7326/m.12031 type:complete len:84 (-) Transcript_7326:1059-1310(-)